MTGEEDRGRQRARRSLQIMRATYGPAGPPPEWNVTPHMDDLHRAAGDEICPKCGAWFTPDDEGRGFRMPDGELCHADCATGRVR